MREVASLDALSSLTALETLYVSNNEYIETLAPLEGLLALEKLQLVSMSALNNIDGILDLSNLKFINLNGNYKLLCDDLESVEEAHADSEIIRPYNCIEEPINWDLFANDYP